MTLLLVILILSALLSISVGIFTSVFGELQISGEAGDSILARNAADEGLERFLYDDLVADTIPGCGGTRPCTYCKGGGSSVCTSDPNPAILSSGACYAVRISRVPVNHPSCPLGNNTFLTVTGEYECNVGAFAVKRSLGRCYQK